MTKDVSAKGHADGLQKMPSTNKDKQAGRMKSVVCVEGLRAHTQHVLLMFTGVEKLNSGSCSSATV